MSDVNAYVYTYTGEETNIPRNVTHIHLGPSVTVIPDHLFSGLYKLEVVDLGCNRSTNDDDVNDNGCQLEEIGNYSLSHCAKLRRITIPPTVHTIGEGAFSHCQSLEEVIFCNRKGGADESAIIETINECTFRGCRSLKQCNLPSTIKTIGHHAFRATLVPLTLPDTVETIEIAAFNECKFKQFRVPPLVDEINRHVFYSCRRMFSLELPEDLRCIREFAFRDCFSLRNVAIPDSAQNEYDVDEYGVNYVMREGSTTCFSNCKDLIKLFGSTDGVRDALKMRFEGLSIHKICYYQSYHVTDTTIECLNEVMASAEYAERAGNKQDCLGMTPLHILACSKKQDLKLYKHIVASHQDSLVTEDRWGCLPIFYALLGSAPVSILNFLVDSHASLFHDNVLDVGRMIIDLTNCGAPLETIKFLLLSTKQPRILPIHDVDWDTVVNYIATTLDNAGQRAPTDTFRFLVYFSISKRVKRIGIKQWRRSIRAHTKGITNQVLPWEEKLRSIRQRLVCAECAYDELVSATSILEMALWKAKINETGLILHIRGKLRRSKTLKGNKASFLDRCRVNCAAEVVITNVLPFLVHDI